MVEIYRQLAPEHRPICIPSGLPKSELESAKEAMLHLRRRSFRVMISIVPSTIDLNLNLKHRFKSLTRTFPHTSNPGKTAREEADMGQ